MRNLLALLAFALLAFVGLGWYFGWYKVQKVPTVTGRPGYQIEIDSKKIKEDVSKFEKRAEEGISDFIESRKDKEKDTATKKPAAGLGTGYGNDTSHLLEMITPRIIIQEEEELRQTGVTEPDQRP